MPKIIAGPELLDRTLADGTTPNPIRQEVLTLALKALFQQSDVRVEVPIRQGEFTPQQMAAMLDSGAEILDFPAWLEFANAAGLDANVPAYVPGATDTEGAPVSWRNWCAAPSQPFQAGGKWYVGTNYHDGRDLPGSILRQLQQDGFTIRLLKAMRTIVGGA